MALDRGGRSYYFGPTDQVLGYFSRHGVQAAADKNVADLLIEIPVKETPSSGQDTWPDVWAGSPEAAVVLKSIDGYTSTKQQSEATPESKLAETSFASSMFHQASVLTERTLKQYWRTPDYVYSRLYASVIHAGLNGLIFLQLGDNVATMQYRIFSAFLVLMIVPEIINATSMMFDENRNIWLGREFPSRIYGWQAFATAQIVAEIPFAIVGGLVYYFLFYFLVGFPLGVAAGYTFLIMLLFYLFITSWGQWIAALR